MQHSSSARTLKVKLHKLPSSVASEASEWSLGINQHTLQPREYMCTFYLSDRFYPTHKPSTSKYSVDDRRWDSPLGFKPALQHYILSFEQLFQDSNVAVNGLHPILTVPHRPQHGLSAASPGLQSVRERQQHSGGLIPRGVKGPHHPHRKQWVPLYRNTPGNRRGNAHVPHDTRTPALLPQVGKKSPFEAPTFQRCHEEESGGTGTMIRRGIYSGLGASGSSRPRPTRGRGRHPICLGSRLFKGHPSSTSPSPGPWVWEQTDSDSDWGSLSDCIIVESQPKPEPEPTPPPPAASPDFRRSRVKNWVLQRAQYSTKLSNQAGPSSKTTSSVLGDAAPRKIKKGARHVCSRERAGKIESPWSHHHQESRSSTAQSPARVLPPTPATGLKGGFAGVEQEIWGVINTSNHWRDLFASAAVLTDRSQQAHVASNSEFVSRVSRISTTMAELVTEVEEALQMTKTKWSIRQSKLQKRAADQFLTLSPTLSL